MATPAFGLLVGQLMMISDSPSMKGAKHWSLREGCIWMFPKIVVPPNHPF